MSAVRELPFAEPLAERLASPPGEALVLYWLGQAGFVIDGGGRRLVIDPYLSNSLAQKYRGTPTPHERMMPVPVAPDDIRHVDLVLVTHDHTDHMDPGTLPALMAANPAARLAAPRAARDTALDRARIAPDRLAAVDAGETLEPVPGVVLAAVRAAHETLERDAGGHHRFLGYALTLAGRTVFHSGDTVPFDGQAGEVAALGAEIALLPVNGRGKGVAGNFTLKEALALARAAGIGTMIAHHYAMFAFNTADPAAIDAAAASAATSAPGRLLRARLQIVYTAP